MVSSLDFLDYAYDRPLSANASYEPTEDEAPLPLDSAPDQYFVNLETVGTLGPGACMEQGIRVLQQKVAGIISELTGGAQSGLEANGGAAQEEYVPRSPDAMMNDQNGMGANGSYTQYGGAQSAWGGGTTYGGGYTQYGGSTTPFGNANGWQ
jgi:DNA-directed RNA polymerase II subunit RPB3